MEPNPHILPAIPILSYVGLEADPAPQRRAALLFFLLLLPALATPFLAFYSDVSPLDVFMEIGSQALTGAIRSEWALTLYATPFFGAIPLLFWKARLIHPRPTSSRLRLSIAIIAATLAAFPLAVVGYATYIWLGENEYDPVLWFFYGGLLVEILYVAFSYVLKRRARREHAVTMALYASYVGNATICLAAFRGGSRVEWGYVLTIVVAIVVLVDTGGAIWGMFWEPRAAQSASASSTVALNSKT